jgi:hypothetical protein
MNEKQALEILKNVLDNATAKGLFSNLNDAAVVIQAYNVIAKKIAETNNPVLESQ